jgi:hypothetical protein
MSAPLALDRLGRCADLLQPIVTCEAPGMVVADGLASFIARSSTESSASFTARLGLVPTQSWEIGDAVGNGRSGRTHVDAGWVLDAELPGEAEPLDAALASLLRQFDGREAALDELRRTFQMHVRCYGSSDSEQGGFWLSAGVIRQLGRLGVEFFCTVYLENSDSPATAGVADGPAPPVL